MHSTAILEMPNLRQNKQKINSYYGYLWYLIKAINITNIHGL